MLLNNSKIYKDWLLIVNKMPLFNMIRGYKPLDKTEIEAVLEEAKDKAVTDFSVSPFDFGYLDFFVQEGLLIINIASGSDGLGRPIPELYTAIGETLRLHGFESSYRPIRHWFNKNYTTQGGRIPSSHHVNHNTQEYVDID